jgi:outer membrane protein assembly factor BamB/calcineurin-like phosphoesterase family protein
MKKLTCLLAFCLLTCLGFLPLNGQEARFSFALITDTHIGGEGADEDLQRTVDDINTTDSIAFVILSGDITEFGSDRELRLAKRILDGLTKSWYIIPGNHDTKWSESGANSFRVIFGDEAFAFTHGGWLFLGTNSGPNMRMGPGQVPRENIVWLDSVLSVPANREKKIISVNHYPLDEGLNNWYELTDRLKKLDTRLALCGHGHSNRVMDFEGIPALMGRSNLRGGKESGGYNIMTITGDSLLTASVRQPGVAAGQAEAVTGAEAGMGAEAGTGTDSGTVGRVTLAAWASVRLVRHDFSADTTRWPRPDYSMNERFSNVREVWRRQEKADIGAGTAAAGSLAVITNTAGDVRALSLRNGREKWVFSTGAKIYSTPAIDGKRVIAVSADGMVRALDLRSGRLLWNFDSQQPVVASPVTGDGKVFIAGSSGRCEALDIRTGKLLWSNGGIDGFVETIPLIYKGMLIFGTWDNRLYALDTETGETRWIWFNGYSNRMLSPAACVPVAVRDRIFVVSPDRKMACLDAATGRLIWQSDLGGATVRESMGLSADSSMVLAKTMNGEVIGVSTAGEEPEIVWRTGFNIGYDIAPAVITGRDGIIFIPSDKGTVHAASRIDGNLLWSHRISSCLINNIVPLKDGSILCNAMDGVVVRLKY